MTESALLKIRCKLEALVTEREGMVALNQQRGVVGASMGYAEESFAALQAKIESLLKEFEVPAVKTTYVKLVGRFNKFQIQEVQSDAVMVAILFDTTDGAIAYCHERGWEVVE
jgi:hypothetical protein